MAKLMNAATLAFALAIALLTFNAITIVNSASYSSSHQLSEALFSGNFVGTLYHSATLNEAVHEYPSLSTMTQTKSIGYPCVVVACAVLLRLRCRRIDLMFMAKVCLASALLPVVVTHAMLGFITSSPTTAGSFTAFTLFGVFYLALLSFGFSLMHWLRSVLRLSSPNGFSAGTPHASGREDNTASIAVSTDPMGICNA